MPNGWKPDMDALASATNVICKISGIVARAPTRLDGRRPRADRQPLPRHVRPRPRRLRRRLARLPHRSPVSADGGWAGRDHQLAPRRTNSSVSGPATPGASTRSATSDANSSLTEKSIAPFSPQSAALCCFSDPAGRRWPTGRMRGTDQLHRRAVSPSLRRIRAECHDDLASTRIHR